MERISKVKRVSIDLAKGRMHIPEVLMTMRRFGKVEVELQWLRPDGKEPQHEVRPAPESLVRVVKYAVEKNPRAASILPKGIVQFCTEMVLTGTGVSVVWEDIMRVG